MSLQRFSQHVSGETERIFYLQSSVSPGPTSTNILYCSCWSSCTQSGRHTEKRLHRWWCSRPPDPERPGRHTWPQPPRQPSPTGRPASPASLHTREKRREEKRAETVTAGRRWAGEKSLFLEDRRERGMKLVSPVDDNSSRVNRTDDRCSNGDLKS